VGKFNKTDYVVPGHDFDFEYPPGQCLLRCECGWVIEIDSYPETWAALEVKQRKERHTHEFGITASGGIVHEK
jgi:hypothetical protein